MNLSTGGNMHEDSVSSLSSQFPVKILWAESVESYYKNGLHYYEQLSKPIESQLADTETAERESQRVWAIECLRKSLLYDGNYEQQLIKIRSLLLLVRIYDEKSEREDRECSFYGAVEIARKYIGDDFQNSSLWVDIIRTYLLVIDPSSKDIGVEKAYKLIMYESGQRRQIHAEKAQLAPSSLKNATTDEIIDKLEEILWPVRLLIVWKDSREVLVSHRFEASQGAHGRRISSQTHEVVVDIFGMPRHYLITIDHWGGEMSNQIKKYEWQSIAKPILEFYIKKKEDYFFTCSSENSYIIDSAEMNMGVPEETNDYQCFLSRILSYPQYLWEFHETKDEFMSYFLQAIDICRIVTLGQQKSQEKLSEEIDRILGRKIRRRVLQMVKSMILSHNETMNGSGSPFWVSKRNISLEWRLYSIIRDYEALVTLLPWGISPETVISRMGEWAKGGYFEELIFKIFSRSVDASGLFQKKTPRSVDNSFLSERRKVLYSSHISSWHRIIELSKSIELQYADGRFSSADENLQKISFEKANVLTQELMREANMRSIIACTRHGKTKSDQGKIDIISNDALFVSPGSKTEPLAAEWEETSRNIWVKCQWLKMEIHSGDLPRAHKTAVLIREGVMTDVCRTLSDEQSMGPESLDDFSCPIHMESSLTNPDKSSEGFWKKRTRSRLSAIILDENTKWLAILLESLASPLKESTSLLVTHGHPANIIDALLENFTRQDGFSSKKTSMKNGEVSVFLLQWNGVVSREGDAVNGLFFSFTEWKSVLLEVNNLSKNVFGEIFYSQTGRLTDLIALHDEFLDFIDEQAEQSPGKLAIFIKLLEKSSSTAHFPEILRAEGVIE